MSPPGTYFVTFTTWQRRRLFVVESYARLFLKTLYGYKRQGRFQLHEFVVMPEHVHLILTPATDITLERAMQLIKGGYSGDKNRDKNRGRQKPGTDGTYPNFRLSQHKIKSPALTGLLQMVY
jgi:REP element-mobilizing transposase RayT